MSCLLNTYKRLPVAFSHGEGVWLWDVEGNRYLDGLSGIGVNALGHAHPALVNAISEQAKRFIHVSNYYQIQNQEAAAERITRLSGLDGVFLEIPVPKPMKGLSNFHGSMQKTLALTTRRLS